MNATALYSFLESQWQHFEVYVMVLNFVLCSNITLKEKLLFLRK